MPDLPEADLYIYKSGVFDLESVYAVIRKWYLDNKFVPFENTYKNKAKGAGIEIVDEWEAFRKITGYTRYWINLEIKGWEVQDVEAVVKGKKVKRAKCRLRMRIISKIQTDYEDRWGENPILEKLRKFYEKYILKKTIDNKYEPEIWKLSYDLHSKLKQALEVEAEKSG